MGLPQNGAAIEVFYLIRWSNPVALTRQFAESYFSYSSGIEHTLKLICKGFRNQIDIDEHKSLFEVASPAVLTVPDSGYDVGAYRSALYSSGADLCCFLNSYSTIQASEWLRSLFDATSNPKVGIAGATASYEGSSPDLVSLSKPSEVSRPPSWRDFLGPVKSRIYFPAFPNPHVRTNAFMVRSEIARRIRWPRSPSRSEALRFESGYRGLTRQVQRLGLDAVIVGRNGRHYGISEWPSSGTFRQNEQHNLLVADNRTADYATASPEIRKQLTVMAWGPAATP